MPFHRVIPDNLPKRLILSLFATEKQGKTHFALTAPEPIYFMNLDYGVQELLGKPQFKEKHIELANHDMTEETDAATYKTLLGAFHRDYTEVLRDGQDGGTLVVDTGTQLWQMIRVVKLDTVLQERIAVWKKKNPSKGEPTDADVRLYAYDYADANMYMAGLVRRAIQQTRMNVIFTHKAKEAYTSDGKATGRFEFQGFGDMPYLVQMTIRLHTKRAVDAKPGDYTMMSTIESCRFDKDLEGLSIEDPDFNTIAAAVQ